MAELNLNESRAASMRNLGIAMTIIPTLSILLRFWARLVTTSKTKFWWDDILAFCAWCCCMCNCAFTFASIDWGLGKHIQAIKPESNVTDILKILYVSQIVFDSGIAFAKFSALSFYLRIFTTRNRRFKIAFWITFALVAIFIAYKLPAQIFLCVPPRKYWEPETPGHCDNDYTNFGLLLAGLLLDVITDLMILILPMPIITGLQMRRNRKVLLFIAFFCGYATWITSIGRMAAFIAVRSDLANPDFTWYEIPELSWSLAEISVSVLSICIPSWFYLIKRSSEHGITSLFSSRGSGHTSLNRTWRSSSREGARNGNSTSTQPSASSGSVADEPSYPGALDHIHSVKVKGGLTPDSETEQDVQDIEMNVVNVRREISVNLNEPHAR